ncbi:hypothetical protein H5410_020465 [Solanum commersonii]|uniref:Uncharacterized protein n=1 Tax=Solanum commersonii TaxID=4109 RepID=A0A9J5ZB99_SOLCO|nr:hypothetical protein H5410_020465 [Solanum commersonii]
MALLQLQGTITPSLANLSFLSILYGIGHMPRLRVIDIQNIVIDSRVLNGWEKAFHVACLKPQD